MPLFEQQYILYPKSGGCQGKNENFPFFFRSSLASATQRAYNEREKSLKTALCRRKEPFYECFISYGKPQGAFECSAGKFPDCAFLRGSATAVCRRLLSLFLQPEFSLSDRREFSRACSPAAKAERHGAGIPVHSAP